MIIIYDTLYILMNIIYCESSENHLDIFLYLFSMFNFPSPLQPAVFTPDSGIHKDKVLCIVTRESRIRECSENYMVDQDLTL